MTLTCLGCSAPVHLGRDGSVTHLRERRAFRDRLRMYRDRLRECSVRPVRIVRAGMWNATAWLPVSECKATMGIIPPAPRYIPPTPKRTEGYAIAPTRESAHGVTLPRERADNRPLVTVWTREGDVNRIPVARVVRDDRPHGRFHVDVSHDMLE